MNIVYASNDAYTKHLGVSIYSLLANNKEIQEINIFILSVGISDESIGKLKDIGNQFGRNIEILELGDLKKRFHFEIDTRGFDISALSRLFIADILPQDIARVLYLDCDTVVTSSLKNLWEIDLENNILGAVLEPTVSPQIKSAIDLEKHQGYFNSGMLLINLDKWRQQNIEKVLVEYYGNKGGNLFACDQDTINGALKGKIKSLPPQYNFFTNFRYFPYRHLVKLVPEYREFGKEVYEEAKKKPIIIHYLGDERPWKEGNYNPYRHYYEDYLEQTGWKDSPKETGMELYLWCYHMLNLMTMFMPRVRTIVNRTLGMKVIDNRKKANKNKEKKHGQSR